MPISDKILPPRQAEVGKIKIGKKAPKRQSSRGKEFAPPEKFETKDGPYFVLTKTIREADGSENFVVDKALMEALKQYNDPDGYLRTFPVMFDSDDLEEIFPHALERYTGNKRWCIGTGDGEGAAVRYDHEKPRNVNCPCDWLTSDADDRCKPGCILWCTILAGADTVIGMQHAFRSHGWNTIRALKGGLKAIYKMVGTVCGVRLWLTVKHHWTKRKNGSWQKVPLVGVKIHAEDIPGAQQRAIADAQRRLQVFQIARNPIALGLPKPGDENESVQEQAAVAQEWYPAASNQPEDSLGGDDVEEAEIVGYNPETGDVSEPAQSASDSASGSATTITTSVGLAGTGGVGSSSSSEPKPGADRLAPQGTPPPSVAQAESKTEGQAERKVEESGDAKRIIDVDDLKAPLSSLPDDAPQRVRLPSLLTKLGELRGMSGADLDRVRKEILAEVTTVADGQPVSFKNLTIGCAEACIALLEKAIAEKIHSHDDDEIPA